MKPSVHIILVQWNGGSETASCLSSLEKLAYENRKVVVVDNGSTDDSVGSIRQRFPWANIILTGQNLGFSGGCNAGMRRALAEGADYVWLLNNDAIADPGALDALVNKAETDPRIGAVGSAIYSMEEPTQLQAWGGGYVNFWMGHARHFLKPVSDEKIQYITGASLLIRRRVLETVGLMDDAIFLYWEDPDYCWRLRQAGWRLAVAGESKIWHKGMSASRKNPKLDVFYNASAVRFFMQHSPTPLLSLSVGSFLRIAKRLMAADWKRARAIWVGVNQGAVENLVGRGPGRDS